MEFDQLNGAPSNGDIIVQFNGNTRLARKVTGSNGVVRLANFTLAKEAFKRLSPDANAK